MNKIKNPYILLIILLVILTLIWLIFFSSQSPLQNNNKSIEGVVSKAHPGYEIKNVELFYVDFYSTVRPADDNHKPTRATVTIQKGNEVRTIHLEKNFTSWKIRSDSPDTGSGVTNGEYYAAIEFESFGKLVDVDSIIKERNLWIKPINGQNYKKYGEGEDYYFSVQLYRRLYKIMNNSVYEFDEDGSKWIRSNVKYSDLNYLGNYTKISKDEAVSVLKKYANYNEE